MTDDLAALMPPGTPPIALFRVLAHNPRILSRFPAGRLIGFGQTGRVGEAGDVNAPLVIAVATVAHAQD